MPVPSNGLSITTYLGAAGMAGMTAYMSLNKIIGDLTPGHKMFVTGVAGAVDQLVVQLAVQSGVRVIASASSAEKRQYVKSELGAEVAVNYKTQNVGEELSKFGGKEGINYYYDNVGGEQL